MSSTREEKAQETKLEPVTWKKTVSKPYTFYRNSKTPNLITGMNIRLNDQTHAELEILHGQLMAESAFIELKEKLKKLGFSFKYESFWENGETTIFNPQDNPKKLYEAFKLICELERIDSGTELDFYDSFGINKPEQYVIHDARLLIANNNIDVAIKFVIDWQNKNYFEPITEVIKNLFEKIREINSFTLISYEKLYQLCEAVSKTNPYYSEAQNLMAHLSLSSAPSSLEDCDYGRTAKALQHAINSNDTKLTNGLLSQLCDLPIGSFNNTAEDNNPMDIIIALATKIRDIQSENLKKTKILASPESGASQSLGGMFGRQESRSAETKDTFKPASLLNS